MFDLRLPTGLFFAAAGVVMLAFGAFNAMSFVSSKAGWAVGPQGRIARFRVE